MVAAGKGSRLQSKVPKQYLKIGDHQIIDICINMISSHKFCKYLIVVLDKDYSKYYKLKNCDLESNYIMKNGILVGCHHGMNDKEINILLKKIIEFVNLKYK